MIASMESGAREEERYQHELVCRVCGSSHVDFVQSWCPYQDYTIEIFDCRSCGVRFVAHDSDAHELLHSMPSSYSSHKVLAEKVKSLFDSGNLSALGKFLAKTHKNHLIIEFISNHPELKKIAEIGCSLGYLTSYSILAGRNIRGFDISQTAVDKASRLFGSHFSQIDDGQLGMGAPYDLVYHVGTVGCVADPIAMTNSLLSLVRPGGWLLFNSPNKKYLEQSNTFWLSTPPPDLVTIFPRKLWESFGLEGKKVIVTERYLSASEWLQSVWLDRKRRQQPITLNQPKNEHIVDSIATKPYFVKRLARVLVQATLGRIRTSIVDPYGLYVFIQRK